MPGVAKALKSGDKAAGSVAQPLTGNLVDENSSKTISVRIPAPLDETALERVLSHWPVGILSVTRPKDAPWSCPIVFAPSDGVLYSPVDGKPKSGGALARLNHIAREGEATLLLERYENDWQALWWIRLSLDAKVIAPAEHEHPAVDALRRKYQQYETTPVLGDPPVLVRLTIRSIAAWAADAHNPRTRARLFETCR